MSDAVVDSETMGDFYSYDVVKAEWKPLATAGSSPGIRFGLAIANCIDRIFIFGGNAGAGANLCLNSLIITGTHFLLYFKGHDIFLQHWEC